MGLKGSFAIHDAEKGQKRYSTTSRSECYNTRIYNKINAVLSFCAKNEELGTIAWRITVESRALGERIDV
jgi:hypothetical protein